MQVKINIKDAEYYCNIALDQIAKMQESKELSRHSRIMGIYKSMKQAIEKIEKEV